MARACTVCAHPERPEIDRALVGDASNRAIARQYALSKDAVARHKAEHLPVKLTRAAEAETVADADALLAEVRSLQNRALAILDTAEKAGELVVALRAIREARGTIELLAKLLGEINEGTTVNVLVAPEWIRLRAGILQAMEPYPAARVALAAVLEDR